MKSSVIMSDNEKNGVQNSLNCTNLPSGLKATFTNHTKSTARK